MKADDRSHLLFQLPPINVKMLNAKMLILHTKGVGELAFKKCVKTSYCNSGLNLKAGFESNNT